MRHSALSFFTLSLGFFLVASPGDAQSTARPAGAPRFKAIFEPVNYQQDLEIDDIVFVNDSVGWAAGAAGTILHTTDRGKA